MVLSTVNTARAIDAMQLDFAVRSINQFDATGVTISFLYTNGRSGSLLLHSILDSHEEIILMPKLFPYYAHFRQDNREFFSNIELAVQYLLQYSGLTYAPEAINGYLGDDKNESVDFDLDDFGKILRIVCYRLDEFNSRTFLLAIHYAYALYAGQDLGRVRSIIVHHHHSATAYQLPTTKPMFDYPLLQLMLDFPKAKMLHTIRHPLDMYYSSMEDHKLLGGLEPCWRQLFGFFVGFYQAKFMEDVIGPQRYHYIRMEDVHCDFEATMQTLCRVLNIHFTDAFYTSTLDGKTWWGTHPNTRPMYGLNPHYKHNTSGAKLDAASLSLCRMLLYPFFDKFGYEDSAEKPERQRCSPWRWTAYERTAFIDSVKDLFTVPFADKKALLLTLLNYPFQRYRLVCDIMRLRDAWPVRLQDLKTLPFWLKKNADWLRAF